MKKENKKKTDLQLIEGVIIVKWNSQSHGGRGETGILDADGEFEGGTDALNLRGEF